MPALVGLRQAHHDVVLAHTGGEALRGFAADRALDVIVMDIGLPGMNGIQMLEELAPRLPETRIVMLTVSDSERDMIEALARGLL